MIKEIQLINKLSKRYVVIFTWRHLDSLKKETLNTIMHITRTPSPTTNCYSNYSPIPLVLQNISKQPGLVWLEVQNGLAAGVPYAWANDTGNAGGKIQLFPFLMGNSPKALAFKCMLQTPKHQLIQTCPLWGAENRNYTSTSHVLHHQISY